MEMPVAPDLDVRATYMDHGHVYHSVMYRGVIYSDYYNHYDAMHDIFDVFDRDNINEDEFIFGFTCNGVFEEM